MKEGDEGKQLNGGASFSMHKAQHLDTVREKETKQSLLKDQDARCEAVK